jgi:PsbP-like protein
LHLIRRSIAFGLALAGLTLALAACSAKVSTGGSSSPSAGGGGTTTSIKTYSNDEYGFSITYSDRFTQGEPVAGTGAGGSSVLDVVFADEEGPVVSDRYVNAVQVSVYELARRVKPSEVPRLESELQGIVDQLMTSLPGARVAEKLSPVEVNGVPGFALKYTYAESGTAITALTSFLISGRYEYQITAQAASADWDSLEGELEAAIRSFTLL